MKRPPFSPLPLASTSKHRGKKEKSIHNRKKKHDPSATYFASYSRHLFPSFVSVFPFLCKRPKKEGRGGHEERSEERFSNRCAKAHGVDKTACEVLDDTMIACAPPRLHAWASQPCAQKVDVQCCVLRGAERVACRGAIVSSSAAPLIERSI